jgi:molecular chaperone GrpE
MKHKKAQERKEQEDLEQDKADLEELRRQLSDLQKERDELFGKLQRVSADYANFQKRAPKQIADTLAYEKEKIIKTLLPVLDNFEHTFQNVESAEDVAAVIKGIRIIYDQILEVLKSHGVAQINALGEKFDPSTHEAMLQRAALKEPDNIVLEEFQKGYRLNGRVIRPSKVVVNKLPVGETALQEQAEQDRPAQEIDLQAHTDDESSTNGGKAEENRTTDTE